MNHTELMETELTRMLGPTWEKLQLSLSDADLTELVDAIEDYATTKGNRFVALYKMILHEQRG